MALLEQIFGFIPWGWIYKYLLGGTALMSVLIVAIIVSCGFYAWLHYKEEYKHSKAIAGAVVAFALTLWIVIGLQWLSRWDNYDYALAYQGLNFYCDQSGKTQVGINIVNVGPTPVKYTVKDFRVVLGSSTLAAPVRENSGGIIPKGVSRIYREAPFDSKLMKPYLNKLSNGSVEFMIDYGPYSGKSKRSLHMKLDVSFHLEGKSCNSADVITEEQETDYRGEQ